MKFGINMFGCNVEFNRDKVGFLEEVSSWGYKYIEPCICLAEIQELVDFAWFPSNLEENMELVKKYNMIVDSAHIFSFDISEEAEIFADIATKYGINKLICSISVEKITKDSYMEILPSIIEAANIFDSRGIKLLLHNSENESKAQIDGISAYEWLLNELHGKVYAQPDVGWLYAGGINPKSFLVRNAEIVKSIHYKDFRIMNNTQIEMAIGNGDVDIKSCFEFASNADIIQISDQDSSNTTMMDDLKNTMSLFLGFY